MTSSLRVLIAMAFLVSGSGCLSTAHSIPKSELVAIAKKAPESRGEKVRVIQTFKGSKQPPEARADCSGGCAVEIRSGGRRRSSGGGGGRSSSSGGGLGKIDGEAAAALAVIVVASAVVIGVVLASSEGARYDGWARLGRRQPLHLYGPNNSYRLVALEDLTLEEANWATRAYVRDTEGAWQGLGRAPLNRKGWAYSVLLGAGEMGDLGGAARTGTASHIQLGYFPTRALGIHGDVGFGWGSPGTGKVPGVRFQASVGLEAQYLPFRAGKVHGGVYGQFGRTIRTVAAGGGSDALLSAGGLFQFDIATRLALTARAGESLAHGESTNEFTLGVSIY